MTFLAPAYLVVAGVLASAVLALHFIVTREPATAPLPTARFAPDRPVRARSRALQLSDLLLLLCRAALILAIGAALAQPIFTPRHRPVARIIMADRSGSVANPAAVGDSVAAIRSPGDVVIPFDSTRAAGSLSAALVTALRTAVAMRDDADSLGLIIVSPFATEEVDQATDSIRALWPGGIRLARVAAQPDSAAPAVPMLVTAPDDPLRFTLPAGLGGADAGVRVVRGAATAADSTWAEGANRALVLWPAMEGPAPDTAGAVSAGDVVVVAPFPRARRQSAPPGRVVARWLDGAPAATEVVHGAGCIRVVDIPVPSAGDLVLDPRFQRLVARLTVRCGEPSRRLPLDESRMAALAGAGKGDLVPAGAFTRPVAERSPLTPWLLAAALALGLVELLLRRRRPRSELTVARP